MTRKLFRFFKKLFWWGKLLMIIYPHILSVYIKKIIRFRDPLVFTNIAVENTEYDTNTHRRIRSVEADK